ncbi:MAG: BppU family phage baseplate upper protein [Staphylococcus equorum]|nr:BppU family phage baseplate upper protein [Staphylococcus equorum]
MPVLKKGEIKVRATAYGTEVKSTGYVFYSYDKNSSALFFQFRNQNGEPTDIANAKIHLLMILEDDEGKEFIPGQEDFEIISKPGGKVKFVLPEMLLSYQGKVTGYINLDFEDGSQTDEGQFSFRIRRSMITHVLPAMGDKYVQDFEDIKERVEQAEDDSRNDFNDSVERINKAETKAKSDMQDSVDQVNKDYEAWKAEQKQENQDFQNEYKQHWQNFKNTQNKNRTDFEDDFKKWKETQENNQTTFENEFSDWKTDQEKKQTDFESDTNKTINGINTKVEETQTKVSDLEKNLDVEQKNYFSVEAWEEQANTDVITNDFPTIKIELEGNTKYTLSTNIPKSGNNKDVFFATGDIYRVNTPNEGVAIDEPRTITTNDDGVAIVAIRDKDITSGDWWIMLNKGETSARWVPNADDLATKQEVDNKVDQSFADNLIEHDFLKLELGFENYNEDKGPTSLQYTRIGPLCYIFGTIRNTNTIEKDSEIVISTLPSHLIITTTGRALCQGSQNNVFLSTANDMNHESYKNQITMSRTRIDNGESHSFNNGKWLNINLMCCVEVID